jgi:hypothetical protein
MSLDAVDAGIVAAGVVSDAAGAGVEEGETATSCGAGPGSGVSAAGVVALATTVWSDFG